MFFFLPLQVQLIGDVARPLLLIVFAQKREKKKPVQFISRPQTPNIFVLLLHLVGSEAGRLPKVDVKHVKCYLPYLPSR